MAKKWTQPVCLPCWSIENPDGSAAARLNALTREVCCMCGRLTTAGIYVRKNPNTVRYPAA